MSSSYVGSSTHKKNALRASGLAKEANRSARLLRKKDYELSPNKCSECSCAIAYEKKTHKFCSRGCAARYNTRNRDCSHSAATKRKIQKKLLSNSVASGIRMDVAGPLAHKTLCAFCGNSFLAKRRCTKVCSPACLTSLKSRISAINRPLLVESSRSVVERRMSEGTWRGWSGKSLSDRSGPEQFVENLLLDRGLSWFKFQARVARYSIDFAFEDQMLALEVDGRQHGYPKSIAHDTERDAFLNSRGWTVFRLKWRYGIKTKSGLSSVLEQFERFVALLKSKCNERHEVLYGG